MEEIKIGGGQSIGIPVNDPRPVINALEQMLGQQFLVEEDDRGNIAIDVVQDGSPVKFATVIPPSLSDRVIYVREGPAIRQSCGLRYVDYMSIYRRIVSKISDMKIGHVS